MKNGSIFLKSGAVLAIMAALFIFPFSGLADQTGQNPTVAVSLPNPLCGAGGTSCPGDIPAIIEQVIKFLRDLALPIVAIMVIFGAYQILTAGGDPEKFSTGRKTILYAAIGYAVIWVGWGIASIIRGILSGS